MASTQAQAPAPSALTPQQVAQQAAQQDSQGVNVNTVNQNGMVTTTINNTDGSGNMTLYQGSNNSSSLQLSNGQWLTEKPNGDGTSNFYVGNSQGDLSNQLTAGQNYPLSGKDGSSVGSINVAQSGQNATANDGTNGYAQLNADGSADVNGNKSLPAGSQAIANNGQGGQNGQNVKTWDQADKGSDPCDTSQKLAGPSGSSQFACAGTKAFMQASQITSIAGQVGGSAVVGTMGQMQTQNLMMNGASQAQAAQSAASLQMKAAGIQTALGATQLMMGIMENSKGNKHEANAKLLSNSAKASSYQYAPEGGVAGPTVQFSTTDQYAKNALSYNGVTNPALTTAAATAQTSAGASAKMGQAGVNEQTSMGQAAKGQGLNDMIKGAAVTAQGLMAIVAAKEQEKLANELANLPNGTVLPGGADNFNPTAQAPNAPTIITGNGDAPPSPVPLTTPVAGPGGTLGTGAGIPSGNGLNNPGPTPDAFVAGNGTSQGGGVGGGGLGGNTGTSASPPGSADDPQAKYAANGGNGAAYQGGGSIMGGGGGQGRGGANGDPSISLKDAFAQLLGQNGDAKKDEPGSDIMNFRKLASDAPFAPLPAGEDFFKYIHQAYEGLQKKGRVGL